MTRRDFKHILEYAAVWVFSTICTALPLDTASALGGFIARKIGPKTGIHRVARAQMHAVFPEFTDDQIHTHLIGMWDNLGRVMAEYPHLERIARTRIVLVDPHGILKSPDLLSKPAIFIAGHFANWEICGPALYIQTGIKLNLIYRAANNPMIDRLMTHYRSLKGILPTLAKSRGGMRAIIDRLGAGQKIGLLIDQKYTEGIDADFFGIPASATTLYAQLGHRFGAPVYPVQVVRDPGTVRFQIIIHPPLPLSHPDGTARPVADAVADAHAAMFEWIRAHPAQWLWVHQRWKRPLIPRE